MSSVLFLLKRNEDSAGPSEYKSSGLLNSAVQVVDMLRESGVTAVLEVVIDGNCIDKFIHKHRPGVVVLEAIWCPPSKIAELQKLHPHVRFVARIHSEIPFLANEGIAVDWLRQYASLGVDVSANSQRTATDLLEIDADAIFLPNYYIPISVQTRECENGNLKVGCFGAVRPMKNQLAQAFAALEYARGTRQYLEFHINGTRLEQGGKEVIKNLRALFAGQRAARLVEHGWMKRDEFLKVVREMDFSLAVSMSETFNIVTADAVSQDVPVVVSPEVQWLDAGVQADPTNISGIARVMRQVHGYRHFWIKQNRKSLHAYNRTSREHWLNFIEHAEKMQSANFF